MSFSGFCFLDVNYGEIVGPCGFGLVVELRTHGRYVFGDTYKGSGNSRVRVLVIALLRFKRFCNTINYLFSNLVQLS